jgi:hypothetical protein
MQATRFPSVERRMTMPLSLTLTGELEEVALDSMS